MRVRFSEQGRAAIDRATNVKCRNAKLIWCSLDVESVAFNRGFYSVDVWYYYCVTVEVHVPNVRPFDISGLAVQDKRVILFGSESNAKVFQSGQNFNPKQLFKANLPTAAIEAVDPICLNVRLVEGRPPINGGAGLYEVPNVINDYFEEPISLEPGEKTVYCTLGQFSIIRLERDTQLVMPCYDFCMPEKECIGGSEDEPCDLFKRIKFPVDEFFPPIASDHTDYRDLKDISQR